MKKLLSIALSVLLILSTVSVMFSLSALAVNPTVTAEQGGTATVEGTTFTATPYFGNTFKGWYTADGDTPVSTAPTFTTEEYTELTAKFDVYNLIPDGSFENGTAGQDYFNLEAGSGMGQNNTVIDNPTTGGEHGNKVLAVTPKGTSNTNVYLIHMPLTVKKNTAYAFHLSFYMPNTKTYKYLGLKGNNEGYKDAWTAYGTVAKWSLHWEKEGLKNESAWSYMGNQSASTIHARTINSNIGIDPNCWIDVWALIETGDDASIFVDGADTGEIWLQFGTANGSADTFYIDNVSFAEVTTENTLSITAGEGGQIVSTGVAQKTLSAVNHFNTSGEGSGDAYATHVVADSTRYSAAKTASQEYTAKPYKDNTFKGWYDGEGQLVSTDKTFNIGSHTNLTAEFNINNQIPDGDFEAGVGINEWTKVIANTNIFKPTLGTGVTGNGMNVAVGGNCLMTAKMLVDVKKDTDYVMSYNIKFNSYKPTQKDDGSGTMIDAGTPVFSPMISGTPSGNYGWGGWPALGGWKITIRNAEDYTKSMTVTSTGAVATPQIKMADIEANCGTGWLELIYEFNTGSDTTNGANGNLFETSDTATMGMAIGCNFAVANIDFDNFAFYEDNYAPNFVTRENVRVSRVGIGTVAEGVPYSFKLLKDASVDATVTYKGQAVAPVGDVYTVTTTDDKNIYVSLANDADYPAAGKDFTGNTLTEYDHDIYTAPIWEGDTVYHENVIFFLNRTEAKLTYPIDSIVSVRSFDLKEYYVKGVDFDVVDGKLVLLEGSSIPTITYGPTSTEATNNFASDTEGVYVTQTSAGGLYPKTLAVTYTHSKTWADLDETGYTGEKQESVVGNLTVFDKLDAGEDVHIVFYGDSMSSGWSISGGKTDVYDATNSGTTQSSGHYTAPYAPSWMVMFIEGLKKEYPDANITFENLSLGGKASGWGLENFAARYELLANKNIDLFLIGWGINDAGASVDDATFKQNEQGIIDAVKAKCPDASFLLYGGNSTNPDAAIYSKEMLLAYEQRLAELAEENDNVAATKLTSVFYDVLSSKYAIDLFENNFNHANDYGCRLYAQVLLSAMSAPESNIDVTDARVTLSENISLEYKLDGDKLAGYTDIRAEFTTDSLTTVVTEYTTDANGDIIFSFNGLNPKNAGDTVTAVYYGTKGGVEEISETYRYSIAKYCIDVIETYSNTNEDYDEVIAVCKGLLNYAAASQTYFNHNPEGLVNEGYENYTAGRTYHSATAFTANEGENKATFMGAGLSFTDTVALRINVAADDVTGLYTVISDGQRKWKNKSFQATGTDGRYYVYFYGLDLTEMSKEVTFTVYNKKGEQVSDALTYSIESYAASKTGKGGAIENLVNAMMNYGDAVKALAER